MIFYLNPQLKSYFSTNKPLFDQLMGLRGEVFRDLEGRLTQRVRLGDKEYFIKQHQGVGWKEIFKNILQGRLPVLGAKNEWQAIHTLQNLNIRVPAVLGYGERGINPATRESFILMEALSPVISLEMLTANWLKTPPTFAFKKALITEVAKIARTLHSHGLNHRDFYICHFLLAKNAETPFIKLSLIDLHRAQIRRLTPKRWIIKDLAALYFSSRDIGLTERDLYRFIRSYRQQSLHETLTNENEFWQKVKMRGEKLYRDHIE